MHDVEIYTPVTEIGSFIGSRKTNGRVIEFSKNQFYFLLHGTFIGIILLYQAVWLFSNSTIAACRVYPGPYKERRNIEPGTLMYAYRAANNEIYTGETTRNGVPLKQETVQVRYLSFAPSISRLDNYEGNWLGFQIAWLIFFVITSMIFFIPNDTMPKNSYIYFTRKKPWIHMIVK